MASVGHQYTLVGYSEELDRRPLFFVEPLPATRVCSACGLAPKVVGLLPCEHFFCKPCYEQCDRSGKVTCPLDGDTCSVEEVTWMNHPARSILAKQVLCWNHTNGCNVVTSAGDTSKHFHHECGHHLARCPRCAAGIVATDVCAHLESNCNASRASSAATVQPRETVFQEQAVFNMTHSDVSNVLVQQISNAHSMAMSSIQSQLKEISRALKIGAAATSSDDRETDERNLEIRLLQESLSRMRIEMGQLKDQLDEFMQNTYANQQTFHNSFVEKIDALKQSLTEAVKSSMDQSDLAAQSAAIREAMADRHRETKAELDRLSVAIDAQYDRMRELLSNTSGGEERPARNRFQAAEAHRECLEQNASEIAWAKGSLSEDRQSVLALLPSILPVSTTHTWEYDGYASLKLRALNHRWAEEMVEPVYLRGYYVSVGVRLTDLHGLLFLFQLHKGKIDQFLEWPFNLKLKTSILKPQGPEKMEKCVKPSDYSDYKQRFLRPLHIRNDPITLWRKGLSLTQWERPPFIKDGRMLLRLTLEPPDRREP